MNNNNIQLIFKTSGLCRAGQLFSNYFRSFRSKNCIKKLQTPLSASSFMGLNSRADVV